MTTKPHTPDELRKQAEKLAEEAAQVQAQLDAHTLREYEREQAAQQKADQKYVDTFNADTFDQSVTDAHDRLRQVIADSPIVQAHATYIAAQWIRNHAHADFNAARDRLGLSTIGARAAGRDDLDVQELITAAVQHTAAALVDQHRQEQAR